MKLKIDDTKLSLLFKSKSIIFFIVFGLIALVFSYFDHDFKYKWVSFFCYLVSIVSGLIFTLPSLVWSKFRQKKYNRNFFIALTIVIIFSLVSRFIYLQSYPFVALGDQVRDGGLNAVQIIKNEEKNIFSYGRYSSHGLIIPEITSLFYYVFGNSDLTYRIPATIVGIVDILLIFFLVTYSINLTSGFWSAIALTAMPLHLFYSRTQIVVIFSSLLTTLLLLGLSIYFNQKNIRSLILIGIFIGFSFNFHASLKPVSFIILMIILLSEFFRKKIKNILLTLFSIIISFGPRLWFSPINVFFHTSRVNNHLDFNIFYKYFYSLGVWFVTPTQSFFKNNLPLISPIFFIFVFVSLVFIVLYKKTNFWLLTIIFLGFAIPFSNSAVTDGLNFDHRLAPLFPISAILLGFGIYLVSKLLNKFKLQSFFFCIIFLLFSYQTFSFFSQRQADVNWDDPFTETDYLSMHLIYLISNQSNYFPQNLCVHTSSADSHYFNFAHVKEQYQYFLPEFSINFIPSSKINSHTLIIDNCHQQYLGREYNYQCNSSFDFKCPVSYNKNLIIYY